MKGIRTFLRASFGVVIVVLLSGNIAISQTIHTKVRKDKKTTVQCGQQKNEGNSAVAEVDISGKIASGKATKKSKNAYGDFLKNRKKNMSKKNNKKQGRSADKPRRQNNKKELKRSASAAEF